MKAVMISIQPKWCEKIANGQKTIEVRKTRPKIDTPFKCYIYETNWKDNSYWSYRHKGKLGKVIGHFVCDRIEELHEYELTPSKNHYELEKERLDLFLKYSCLSYDEICEYRKNLPYFKPLYGWHISNLVIYEQPKELSEFFHYCGDDTKCDGCPAHYFSNTECGKEDYCCSIIDGCKPLTRPPQSWQFVEEKEKENERN